MFPDTKVYHLDAITSDHKALLIRLEGMECNQQKPFRFEQMWMAEQRCGTTIEVVLKKDIETTACNRVLLAIG